MLAIIFHAIKTRVAEHNRLLAAKKREDEFVNQQVELLMQEHGWSYSKAFAVYMVKVGKWEY